MESNATLWATENIFCWESWNAAMQDYRFIGNQEPN